MENMRTFAYTSGCIGALLAYYLALIWKVADSEYQEPLVQQRRPLPGILERHDLRRARVSLQLFEYKVVVKRGVERRVQVDQIHGFICHLLPEHIQVIPIVESVLHNAV